MKCKDINNINKVNINRLNASIKRQKNKLDKKLCDVYKKFMKSIKDAERLKKSYTIQLTQKINYS